MMPFTALINFRSEETHSDYIAGLSYTARTDSLVALIARWASEGKVQIGASRLAVVSGVGVVE